MNIWLFHQNGFTRSSLSATVTRVGNFVEENVCVVCFYTIKAPGPGGFRLSMPEHNRLNMSIAMHSACSKHRIKVVSINAQFYF